ncbi:hypothetical protein J3B00_004700 [Pseudomonas sp. BP8]|nr:hypothetical protein [Pseudomonas sp. BP8]
MNTAPTVPRRGALELLVVCLLALLAVSLLQGQWPDYAHMAATLDQPLSRLRWIVGDISEVAFYKHELPALGLLLGAALAHWAHCKGYRWQGFAICYGSGLWPWLLISALLGLLLSHAVWGWTLASGTWQPTFVAFVSLPSAMVLLFGGGWRVALSGALLGALLVTPASLLLVNLVCYPLQLPVVVGNVGGMALAVQWPSSCASVFRFWSLGGDLHNSLGQPHPSRRQTTVCAGPYAGYWPTSARRRSSAMNWPAWDCCSVYSSPTCWHRARRPMVHTWYSSWSQARPWHR